MLRGIILTLVLALNSLITPIPVLICGLLQHLFPCAALKKLAETLTRVWIGINNAVCALAVKEWQVTGDCSALSKKDWYFIFSNHQTWIDIFVLDKVFANKTPVPKFFLKKQLQWCMLTAGFTVAQVGYPLMVRPTLKDIRKNPKLKESDPAEIKKVCRYAEQVPTAFTSFVEGTRFSPKKQASKGGNFKHLLKPHAVTLAMTLHELPEHIKHIVDATIYYPQGVPSLWNFLKGRCKKIVVEFRILPVTEDLFGDFMNDRSYRTHIQGWLNEVWQQKDALLDKLQEQHAD